MVCCHTLTWDTQSKSCVVGISRARPEGQPGLPAGYVKAELIGAAESQHGIWSVDARPWRRDLQVAFRAVLRHGRWIQGLDEQTVAVSATIVIITGRLQYNFVGCEVALTGVGSGVTGTDDVHGRSISRYSHVLFVVRHDVVTGNYSNRMEKLLNFVNMIQATRVLTDAMHTKRKAT